MPQENMSKFIGNSPSPSIQRVITNNTNVQQPLPAPAGISQQFNKNPVSDLSKK